MWPDCKIIFQSSAFKNIEKLSREIAKVGSNVVTLIWVNPGNSTTRITRNLFAPEKLQESELKLFCQSMPLLKLDGLEDLCWSQELGCKRLEVKEVKTSTARARLPRSGLFGQF